MTNSITAVFYFHLVTETNRIFLFNLIQIVISADTTVALCGGAKDLLIVCQSFFIIWGAIICFSYLFCGYRILSFTKCNQKILMVQSAASTLSATSTSRVSTTSEGKSRFGIFGKRKSSVHPSSTNICTSVLRITRITMYSAILGIACVILNTYSLFGIYGVLAPPHFPQPWPWLMYQSIFRLVELGMAFIMAYTTNRPSKNATMSHKSTAVRTADWKA